MLRGGSFIALLGAICISVPAGADQSAARYHPPQTQDGRPSFEGTGPTPLSLLCKGRARYSSLVIPPGEVEEQTATHPQVVRQRTDDEQDESKPLTRLRSAVRSRLQRLLDRSRHQVRARERRIPHSWIVDPADGQVRICEGVRERLDAARGNFDGPEARPLGERCIINSNSAGPPMLNYLYNNNYEFVQTADALVIRAEMNNYARRRAHRRPSSAAGRPRLAWRLPSGAGTARRWRWRRLTSISCTRTA
jgi:hypothetical protein